MKTLKDIVSITIALLAAILFGGIIIFNFVMVATKDFSAYSMLAACIASIIPAVFCYSFIAATIEYIKEEMLS